MNDHIGSVWKPFVSMSCEDKVIAFTFWVVMLYLHDVGSVSTSLPPPAPLSTHHCPDHCCFIPIQLTLLCLDASSLSIFYPFSASVAPHKNRRYWRVLHSNTWLPRGCRAFITQARRAGKRLIWEKRADQSN